MKLAAFTLLSTLLIPGLMGCNPFPQAEAQSRAPRGGGPENAPAAVDISLAKTGRLQTPVEYIGTTQPAREIQVRSQVEGRLLSLAADVGDSVRRGQIIARLDDSLLMTNVSQAQAELAARQSEVASAQTQVANAEALVAQRQAELAQAQRDAARLSQLTKAGAIPRQQAETAQTAVQTNRQTVIAAQEQVRTAQQGVVAAQKRVAAQQALVAQASERRSYTLLAAPSSGVIVAKATEPGSLVSPGGEVVRIGDFSQVKVVVPVSELELANLRVGQSANVRLDAFPQDSITGTVSRISPAADATSRQIPVEVTIPNNGNIGSGLLARVSFVANTPERVVIPQTALEASQERRGQPRAEGGQRPSSGPSTGKIFVAQREGRMAKVQAREVQLGDRSNGQVEILAGLRPGEPFISRAGRPLKDGETVRVSVLSETGEKPSGRPSERPSGKPPEASPAPRAN